MHTSGFLKKLSFGTTPSNVVLNNNYCSGHTGLLGVNDTVNIPEQSAPSDADFFHDKLWCPPATCNNIPC